MRRSVLVSLAGSALIALGFVVAVLLAGGATPEPTRRPPDGPALRLAGRAGLVTVGLAARERSLEFTLIGPEVDGSAVEIREIALVSPGGASTRLELRPCGPRCHLAPVALERGVSTVRVAVAFAGRPAAISMRVPWPLPPDGTALLEEAVAATGRLHTVTVRDRISSDPTRGFFSNRPERVRGAELVGFYAPDFAVDARELPAADGMRRVAYALPSADLWFEVWIGDDGLIRRDRVTGPNHLLRQHLSIP